MFALCQHRLFVKPIACFGSVDDDGRYDILLTSKSGDQVDGVAHACHIALRAVWVSPQEHSMSFARPVWWPTRSPKPHDNRAIGRKHRCCAKYINRCTDITVPSVRRMWSLHPPNDLGRDNLLSIDCATGFIERMRGLSRDNRCRRLRLLSSVTVG